MTTKKILILPSWYATAQAPTSGSFFHEQSLLLEDRKLGSMHWEVQVLTTEKKWISRKRHWYYKVSPNKIPFLITNQHINSPSGKVIYYPFCKFISDEANLKREVQAILEYYVHFPDQKPDIIHAHCALKGGVLARYVAQELKIPYVLTEHMNPFLLHNYTDFWKQEIVASLEKANEVLAVSQHQKQHILMHEIECNPIVTGNLVDDARFIQTKDRQEKGVTNFLIVTFYPNFIKDMDTFFESLVILQKSNKLDGKHFTIVGGGEISGEFEQNYYQTKIDHLDLHLWVTVVPKASRQEMVELMQKTDTLISTSIAESFGVAICEAMLCGKPVVTTLNGGVNDYLTKDNSLVVPIKDPKALSEAICNFIISKDNFDATAIRSNIITKYGRSAFRQRMDGIYQKVLK